MTNDALDELFDLALRSTCSRDRFKARAIELLARAIRNAVLEEAASVCESLYKGHEWIFETRPQSHACADVIRAMKTKEGE